MLKIFCMKFYIYVLAFSLLMMAGCTGSDSTESETVPVDTVTSTTIEIDSSDIGSTITNIPPLWRVEVQEDQSEKLKQPETNASASLAPQEIVSALNESYPDIHLNFKSLSHDTAYISIPESSYLTNQIGNTGAYNYLATAVFNITEAKGVKYVNFEFKVGDHATPGTYKRDDFKKLR